MTTLVGIAAALTLGASSPAAQAQSEASQQDVIETQFRRPMRAWLDTLNAEYDYRWYEVSGNDAVQFGHPEGGAGVTIRCNEGRIELLGSADTNEDIGFSFEVRFANGERRTASLIDAYGPINLGDGPVFLVGFPPDDPLLAWMLDQTRLEIEAADFYEGPGVFISAPTAGGLELLRSFVAGCRG